MRETERISEKNYNNLFATFRVFHNLQANERCYYKRSYIKSNSLFHTYLGTGANALFYNWAIEIY